MNGKKHANQKRETELHRWKWTLEKVYHWVFISAAVGYSMWRYATSEESCEELGMGDNKIHHHPNLEVVPLTSRAGPDNRPCRAAAGSSLLRCLLVPVHDLHLRLGGDAAVPGATRRVLCRGRNAHPSSVLRGRGRDPLPEVFSPFRAIQLHVSQVRRDALQGSLRRLPLEPHARTELQRGLRPSRAPEAQRGQPEQVAAVLAVAGLLHLPAHSLPGTAAELRPLRRSAEQDETELHAAGDRWSHRNVASFRRPFLLDGTHGPFLLQFGDVRVALDGREDGPPQPGGLRPVLVVRLLRALPVYLQLLRRRRQRGRRQDPATLSVHSHYAPVLALLEELRPWHAPVDSKLHLRTGRAWQPHTVPVGAGRGGGLHLHLALAQHAHARRHLVHAQRSRHRHRGDHRRSQEVDAHQELRGPLPGVTRADAAGPGPAGISALSAHHYRLPLPLGRAGSNPRHLQKGRHRLSFPFSPHLGGPLQRLQCCLGRGRVGSHSQQETTFLANYLTARRYKSVLNCSDRL
ncbi:uncharacterized protein LOC142587011 isoform X2 [Dermacentor variabilis]|uniref:uncharacterized protein LOC142587011 isoform X2 n=1 Tax=Dermacentor variabilis TaxID=34621 RepID=UPI003F5CAFCF